MTPRERADKAKQLLDDPIVQQAFSDIREQIVLRLEACPVSEVDAQHDLAITLQLLKQLKLQLGRYVEEIVVDNAKARQDAFIRKTRQTLLP
jgi:hypothetical protein